jgi:predicted ATPase/DNA-binding XRE family transcriptional regulator
MNEKLTEDPSFGEWLRQRRRLLDLTQQELADQVGCARITLRRIESGTLKPSKELAQILLEKLDTPPIEREALLRFARGLSGSPEHWADFVSNKLITNLHTSLTTIVGREKEKEEIIHLTAQNRLVTLAGAGGVGKTRLALYVGKEILQAYPDGVWFAAFDSLTDPALVPATVAAVFDIREGSSDRPLVERLIYSLQAKKTLLILDNCEHLLDACAQLIKDLLTHCPNLKVLTTSREIVGLEGEAVYFVPPLSAPASQNLDSLERLAQYESIQLFIHRAQLTQSHFSMTKENAPFLVQICQRLDGIPLAIELAAAYVDILQLKEMLKQLNQQFDLLVGNRRSVNPRQQTMRASVDWSWELLSKEEQKFMAQLSVFAGGWTLESAQAVCDGNVLNLMSALVKKSLILVERTPQQEIRYRFHEVVLQFAIEKLVNFGEEEIIRTRHLNYFLSLSEQAESAFRGPTQVEWMAGLHEERDNIRAALNWADKTKVEAGLYLSGRLHDFWENFDLMEGEQWLAKFVQKPESKAYHHARGNALYAQARCLFWLQRFDEAHKVAKECLDLYKVYGNEQDKIDGLSLLAIIGDDIQARELIQQALILAQSIDDVWRTAYTLLMTVRVGQHPQNTHSYLIKALNLFREAGDLRYMAECMAELGRFETFHNNIESAQKILYEAISLFRQLNMKSGLLYTLDVYGRIAAIKGNYEEASAMLQEGAVIAEEYGYRLASAFYRTHLGYLALDQGQITEARDAFAETTRDFFDKNTESGVIFALEGMAELFVTVDKPKRAAQLIGWADATREKIGDTRPLLEKADVDKVIAACLQKMGEVMFSVAYEEGQKMTLEEAVAYALEEK